MNHNDIPCRVSAETRQHYSKLNAGDSDAPRFDETDEDCLKQVVSKDVAVALAKVFNGLLQVDMSQGSFGVDAKKALDYLLPDLRELRSALHREWRDAL